MMTKIKAIYHILRGWSVAYQIHIKDGELFWESWYPPLFVTRCIFEQAELPKHSWWQRVKDKFRRKKWYKQRQAKE